MGKTIRIEKKVKKESTLTDIQLFYIEENENDSDDSPEDDPEQYIVDTTNLIKQNILEYVDNGGYPLCEYLDFYNLENYVKWLLEQT
jgi:hypothetical protein